MLQLNRPKSLNAFGGNLLLDLVTAVRELNEHPDTVFTVLTGEGRFFSSGADVKGSTYLPTSTPTIGHTLGHASTHQVWVHYPYADSAFYPNNSIGR